MKILLDENLPDDFRLFIAGHEVATTHYHGWDGLKNGRLLAIAAEHGFEALVTIDRGMQYEQNLQALPMSIVLLAGVAPSLPELIPIVPALLEALDALKPRTFVRITPGHE